MTDFLASATPAVDTTETPEAVSLRLPSRRFRADGSTPFALYRYTT